MRNLQTWNYITENEIPRSGDRGYGRFNRWRNTNAEN